MQKKKTIFIVPLFLLIWRIVLNDNRYLIWQNMTFNSSIIIIEGAIMGQGMWSFMYEYTQLSPSKKSGRHCFHSILFLFETVTRYAFFFLLKLVCWILKNLVFAMQFFIFGKQGKCVVNFMSRWHKIKLFPVIYFLREQSTFVKHKLWPT